MGPKKTQKDTSMDESAGISRSSDQDTLTELLKTLVTTMSKGQEDMANLMKKTLNKESMTQEQYRVEMERSEKQKRSERILTKIADIKDGDDPEVYLESLKNKLIQAYQDGWRAETDRPTSSTKLCSTSNTKVVLGCSSCIVAQ